MEKKQTNEIRLIKAIDYEPQFQGIRQKEVQEYIRRSGKTTQELDKQELGEIRKKSLEIFKVKYPELAGKYNEENINPDKNNNLVDNAETTIASDKIFKKMTIKEAEGIIEKKILSSSFCKKYTGGESGKSLEQKEEIIEEYADQIKELLMRESENPDFNMTEAIVSYFESKKDIRAKDIFLEENRDGSTERKKTSGPVPNIEENVIITDGTIMAKEENHTEKTNVKTEESDMSENEKNEKTSIPESGLLESLGLRRNYFVKNNPQKWIYIHKYIKNDQGKIREVVFSQSGKNGRKPTTLLAEEFISIIRNYDLGEGIKNSQKDTEKNADTNDGSVASSTAPEKPEKKKTERKKVEFTENENLDIEGYVAFARSYLEDIDNWYTEENDFDKEDIPALAKRARKRLWEKEIYAEMIEDRRIREEIVPEAIEEVKKRIKKTIRHEAEAENTLTEEIPDKLKKAV